MTGSLLGDEQKTSNSAGLLAQSIVCSGFNGISRFRTPRKSKILTPSRTVRVADRADRVPFLRPTADVAHRTLHVIRLRLGDIYCRGETAAVPKISKSLASTGIGRC
ncbi:hypothetical protein ACFQS6_09840 [Xanthomonas populi]